MDIRNVTTKGGKSTQATDVFSTLETAWTKAHPGAVQRERVQGDIRRADIQELREFVHLLKVAGGRSVLVRAEFAVRQTLECCALSFNRLQGDGPAG